MKTTTSSSPLCVVIGTLLLVGSIAGLAFFWQQIQGVEIGYSGGSAQAAAMGSLFEAEEMLQWCGLGVVAGLLLLVVSRK